VEEPEEMQKTTAKSTTEEIDDVLLVHAPDRRSLPMVIDNEKKRTNIDRRDRIHNTSNISYEEIIKSYSNGVRHMVDYPIEGTYIDADGLKKEFIARAHNVSGTGILFSCAPNVCAELEKSLQMNLKFEITPGSMPEGYEMKVNIQASYVRTFTDREKDSHYCGVEFKEPLAEYLNRRRGRYMLAIAAILLFLITAIIMLMRTESIIYYKFNKVLYTYSIITAAFLLTRYFFGSLYRPEKIDKNFTPGVTIIVPCFNEETWIEKTILGCINQDYPTDRLEVIVVDDCSTDNSVAKINTTIERLKKEQRYDVANRLFCLPQPVNKGKRECLALGAKKAKHDLVVFVDSDSFLEPFAIRNLVQPFIDTEMGGVSGRTDVANTYTNSLTKMQSVRYYIAFRMMKAAEGFFDAVTCLSGPLSCYRKDLVLKYCDAWLGQKFLGQRATFGDDRSLTNFILRHNRTGYQDTAVCYTIVPNTYSVFLKQQMRWKRSWLRESLIATGFMWEKEPFMALSFYMGVLVPLVAPLIVLYNLVYIPLIHRVFPTTFILGMILMAGLMSIMQLLLRKSTTWIYGIWFCVYYEIVLLWQMPIAWVTFWKSTWGTRMTPADVKEQSKKAQKAGAKL
jgi:Glycosyltransferases, probably involved in cell wall biogenesis